LRKPAANAHDQIRYDLKKKSYLLIYSVAMESALELFSTHSRHINSHLLTYLITYYGNAKYVVANIKFKVTDIFVRR